MVSVETNESCVAYVTCKSDGKLISLRTILRLEMDSLIIKFKALELATRLIEERNYYDVLFESNSLILVNLMNNQKLCRNGMCKVFRMIFLLCSGTIVPGV